MHSAAFKVKEASEGQVGDLDLAADRVQAGPTHVVHVPLARRPSHRSYACQHSHKEAFGPVLGQRSTESSTTSCTTATLRAQEVGAQTLQCGTWTFHVLGGRKACQKLRPQPDPESDAEGPRATGEVPAGAGGADRLSALRHHKAIRVQRETTESAVMQAC